MRRGGAAWTRLLPTTGLTLPVFEFAHTSGRCAVIGGYVVRGVESLFEIKLLAADVYFISDLPADLRMADVLQIAGMALLLSFLSTLYPAWRGASTAPAEALRYE